MRNVILASTLAAAIAVAATYVLIGPATAQPAPAPMAGAVRYSTQVLAIPPALAITDHHVNKLYLYHMEKKDIKLAATIDLTHAGQPRLPVTEPPEPATQPASD